MSLFAVCRCDAGGLGAISMEAFRHLQPDRTLLLNLGDAGRSLCNPSAFDLYGSTGQQVYPAEWTGGLSDRAIEWLCADAKDVTLISFETFYDAKLLAEANRAGAHTVCYAMPELAPWAVDPGMRPRPRQMYVPTEWRAGTVPNAEVLPMPVARDRLPFRARDEVHHLFHVTGSAMLDRNGTTLLTNALSFVESQVRVTIRSEKPLDIPACHAHVEVVSESTPHYWEMIPSDVDLLVLPRRYGGLSLPIQEAASLGIPTLTLESDPYASFGFAHAIPTTRSRDVRMKGGLVPVFDADPRVLARAIDWLVAHPGRQHAASHAADAWAEAHSWSGPLGLEWCERLSANCSAQEAAA